MSQPVLELHAMSKRFGSVTALEDVSFTARKGSVHALLGENGAGKTTLMRVAFGMLRPDSGWIVVEGERKTIASPSVAIASGIGMVHQQFSLVPAMTVAENVALGGKGVFSRQEVARRLEEVGQRTGLFLDPDATVASLGSAERQKLEIVRTLAHDARILILDEPTAVLTPRDIGELFAQLRIFADTGGSVVLITHKLRDALEHADHVTVLRRGRVALDAPMADMTETSLAQAMLGEAPDSTRPALARGRAAQTPAVVVLSGVVLTDNRGIERKPVDLELTAGEILGVAALEGAASSLLRVIAGRARPTRGTIRAPDNIGFVPENRLEEGVIPDFSLTENFALRGAGERTGIVPWNELRDRTTSIIEQFDVRTSGSQSEMASLSGGNQQRFVLGRELEDKPPLLILENPTQGLDVRAAAAIHERIRAARDAGTTIVFYSSDIDELAEISDRVFVVRNSGHAFCEPVRESVGRLLLEADAQAE